MILHLQTVPARNGVLWVRHGLKVFQRKPLALTGLFGMFMFLGFALMLIPALGPLLLLAMLPLVSLGFMLATHQVLQAQTPNAAVFLAPLQLTPERRNTQLVLGVSYALATVAIMFFSDWLDGGSFAALQDLLGKGDVDEKTLEAALAEPRLFWGSLTRLSLATLLSIPFWHAPALVHWGGQGALQALFSSTLGVWRNKTAFALSALCWGGLALALSSLLTLVFSLLGLGKLVPMMILPAGLMLSTVFYSSLYFTFVDCFMFGAPRDLLSEKR